MASAHVIATLQLPNSKSFPESIIPRIVDIGIYSTGIRSLTSIPGYIFAEILAFEGEQLGLATFSEVQKYLLEHVNKYDGWAWLRPWINPGKDDHMRRYDIYQFLARQQ